MRKENLFGTSFYKKAGVIALAAVLTCGTLSGCGSKEKKESSKKTESTKADTGKDAVLGVPDAASYIKKLAEYKTIPLKKSEIDEELQKKKDEQLSIETPFAHMTYTEAIKVLEPHNGEFEFPVHWGSDIQTEHERYLTEQVCKSPVIVTDYPAAIKSFYMKQNEDGKTVRGMDVLVPRLGEIIGGSEREVDYDKLLARMRQLGMNTDAYWWYTDLRKYGSVPHSGFGLGFERAVMYVTGMQNIRDVIPYPRAVGQIEF